MPSDPATVETFDVLDVPIHATRLEECTAHLLDRARSGQKGWVIFRDVHGVIRCRDDPEFLDIHRRAFRVCPDGMPLVWIGKRRGHSGIGRVYGPDLMRSLFSATRDGSFTHYLYGGAPGVADRLRERLESDFPGARVAGTRCPPYGPLSEKEFADLEATLRDLRPDFFWVGLSTPKQERFMAEYLDRLDTTVMLGVGAAFDYLSGGVKEPPVWLRKSGLQWLARICQEPRRLLRRYLHVIPRFCFLYFFDRRKSAIKKS